MLPAMHRGHTMSAFSTTRNRSMSFNLVNLPHDERQAQEDEKARLFEFWQLNLERAKGEAGKLWSEKDKRKAKWKDWVAEQIDALSPPEYQSLVKRELERMG